MRKHILIAAMIIAASSLIFWGCQKEIDNDSLVYSENSTVRRFMD